MPGDDGLGFDQAQWVFPSGPELAQDDPEGPIPIAELWPVDLPLQNEDLLAQALVVVLAGQVFFKIPSLKGQIGYQLFQMAVLLFEVGHFIATGLTLGVASQAALAGLQEFFGPVVIEIGIDAFTAAKLGDGLFTMQAFQNYADLLFGGKFAACLTLDLTNDFFEVSALSYGSLLRYL